MIEDITRDGWQVTPQIDNLTLEGAKLSRPLKAGTVVMTVSGNVGICAQLAVDACIHDGFVGFKNLNNSVFEPFFFGKAISLLKAESERLQAGAIFQNITTDDVKTLQVIAPPIELQHAFIIRTTDIKVFGAQQAISRRRIDELFQSFLHRAFIGTL
jgi:restriction endonuclease S subunit